MRVTDEFPLDPDIAAELDAIDATLRGEAVDPRFAEVAELALLVAADRPRPSPEFAASLDERVAHRFAPAPGEGGRDGGGARTSWWSRLSLWPAAGGMATAAAAIVAVVIVVSGGSSSHAPLREGISTESSSIAASTGASSSPSVPSAASGSGVKKTAPFGPAQRSRASVQHSTASSAASTSSASSVGNAASTSTTSTTVSPTPVQPLPNGRKIVQSAQLQLTAPPTRVDDVAQELFNVIGAEHGIVNRSSVTATGGLDGYADFALSVPSGNLADTMRQLSSLHYAKVASRTDSSQDVNGQYVSDQNRLADAQALRTGLLKQLAAATTQAEIDSLNARIHDAENAIAADQKTIRDLQQRIGYSTISVNINAAPVPPVTPTHSGGGGFTLHRAVHDAGRVLTVAAGVALITLAALVPIGLVAAFALWIGTTIRRRRREHALDVA
jgi:Domain of unknown function (DUF4349)